MKIPLLYKNKTTFILRTDPIKKKNNPKYFLITTILLLSLTSLINGYNLLGINTKDLQNKASNNLDNAIENGSDYNNSLFNTYNNSQIIQNYILPESQTFNTTSQVHASNYVWNTLGYNGNSNASIAVLSSGIDDSHIKFGENSFGDKDFSKKIVGWNDTIDNAQEPTDPNGLGTFVASVSVGVNSTNGSIPLDSQNRYSVSIGGNFSHFELFKNMNWFLEGNFEINLGSFYVPKNTNITVNGAYTEQNSTFINMGNISLSYQKTKIITTSENINNTYSSITYNVTTNPGIYDVIFQYNVGSSSHPVFNVSSFVNVTIPNDSVVNSNFTGVAPETKIFAARVFDKDLIAHISHIIDILQYIHEKKDVYHIVAVMISLGEYQWDTVSYQILSDYYDQLIKDGILIVIPAGDSGLDVSDFNSLAVNEKILVIGSTNEYDQLTYYSSKSRSDKLLADVDLLAPGGSRLNEFRSMVGADSNDNDLKINGNEQDLVKNDTTIMSSTSISAGIVSACFNLLIESLGGYETYKSLMSESMVLQLKSILLMTATETNMNRENNPYITEDDIGSDYYDLFQPVLNRGTKDDNEGYGVMNIDAAIEAVTKTLSADKNFSGYIVSSISNASGRHAYARKITLEKNEVYQLNLSYSGNADLDMYIYYYNYSLTGEPILFKSATKAGTYNESIFLPIDNNTMDYVVVVKAISGEEVNFTLHLKKCPNTVSSQLNNAKVESLHGINDILDVYNFSVTYKDTDNIPPIKIYVHIDGFKENITLIQSNPEDINYFNGVQYYALINLYEAKTYTYHFAVFDGKYFQRYPFFSESEITVLPVSNGIQGDYQADFSKLDKWSLDPTWSKINQNNSIDYRGNDYNKEWWMLYFGDNSSVLNGLYSYNGITFSTNQENSSYSPQILIDDNTAMLGIGLRVSLNINDKMTVELRVNRSDSWENIKTYTNTELDWHMLWLNLSDYANDYIQIRFHTLIDGSVDDSYSKGIIISDFRVIQNWSNSLNSPEIFNITLTPLEGHVDMKYHLSFYYCDKDGDLPYDVFVETEIGNYSMKNPLGDWNPYYSTQSGNLIQGGIYYSINLTGQEIGSQPLIIHYLTSDGWKVSESIQPPTINSQIDGIYPFFGNQWNLNPTGNVKPIDQSLWVTDTNTFHYITSDNVWYLGTNEYKGYVSNLNVNLNTPCIHVPEGGTDATETYLMFNQKLIFEGGTLQNDIAKIEVSTDFGNSWEDLIDFTENIDEYSYSKISLSSFGNEIIIIRFTFQSDGLTTPNNEGTGWYLANISIGLDPNIDTTKPAVEFHGIVENMTISGRFLLNITITDESGINDNRVVLYLIGPQVLQITSVSKNGIIEYWIDTNELMNGDYKITVIAYDYEGNQIYSSMNVHIYNKKYNYEAIFTIILLSISIAAAITIYLYRYFKEKEREMVVKILKEGEYNNLRDMSWNQKLAIERVQKQVRENEMRLKVEMATSQSEKQKPFKLYCKNCKNWFENNEFEWICPNCNHDSLYVAYHCEVCNRWYFKDEPKDIDDPDYYTCKKCKIKLLK